MAEELERLRREAARATFLQARLDELEQQREKELAEAAAASLENATGQSARAVDKVATLVALEEQMSEARVRMEAEQKSYLIREG